MIYILLPETSKQVFYCRTQDAEHYRNAPIEKRRPWKLGYPLGFASSNKVSKTTAIFRCRQISERRISNFSLTPLSRQYRYNRRINHCFEVSKCRFHRQRLQSVKYFICEMNSVVTETLQTIEALSVSWNQLLAACDLKNFTCFNFLIFWKSSFVLSSVVPGTDRSNRSMDDKARGYCTDWIFFTALLRKFIKHLYFMHGE